MPKTSIELREERATEIAEARKTWTDAETRDGGPTEEDRAAFDRAMDGADTKLDHAKRLERLESAEADLDAPGERRSLPIDRQAADREERSSKAAVAEKSQSKIKAYRQWLRTGEVREDLRYEASVGRAAFETGNYPDAESRDVTIATATQGGYLITPVQISDDIVSQLDNLVFVRDLCRASNSITTVTSAQKLGVRQKTARMSAPAWTTEIGSIGSADSTLAFNRRDLEPQQLSKLALISIRTLMLTRDAEREVNDELGYQFAVAQENAYLNGSGSGQPLGVFTASSSGISTGRDVVCAHSTVVTGDDLINAKFSIKGVYWNGPSTAWIMHRLLVQQIRKIKMSSVAGYGDQQYVWEPGLTNGAPDRVLDIPLKMSEYAPATFTANQYAFLLGNFRYYRIAELATIPIQRLTELYAATGEVGFIGRYWGDGSPVLEEAFARGQLAATG